MLCIHSFSLVVTFFLCCTSIADAIVLQDLPHLSANGWPLGAPRLVSRQEDCGMLSLRSTESFLWGGEDGSSTVLGHLTVHFPGDEENILSMQRFKGVTKSVTCSNDTNSIEIAFQDDKTFQCAKNLWDWVNGAENHTFVMVAGTGDCGWNDRRVPFIVSTIQYDKEANTAHLGAIASEWGTAAHSYELHVGTLEPQSATTRRSILGLNINRNTSIDFEHKVPDVALTFPVISDLSVTFACVECNTHGNFQFGFHLETQLFGLKKASVTLSPRGVNMDIHSKVTFSDSLVTKKRFAEDLIAIPLGGITIEDIVDLGPEIVFQAGVDVGPLTASTTFTSGVSISLEDSAQMTLDLLGSGVTSNAWTPTVSQKPLSVDARITGEVKAFVKARIQLSATALGLGYTAGVGLSPYVSANLSALASDTSACPGDDQKHAFGVSAGAFFGVEVKAEIEENGQPLLEKVLWDEQQTLASLCLPFGPKLANASSPFSALLVASATTRNVAQNSTSPSSIGTSILSPPTPFKSSNNDTISTTTCDTSQSSSTAASVSPNWSKWPTNTTNSASPSVTQTPSSTARYTSAGYSYSTTLSTFKSFYVPRSMVAY